MPERRSAPPGELDLELKLAMRRIFWGMNYATRVNLLLALPGSARKPEELSDLDCVGFSVGGDFSVRLLIADCKSGSKVSPATRLFWLAGVRDFFGADRAYAVIKRRVPESAREQAGRLGVDVVGDDDRQILENVHGRLAPPAPFFAVGAAVKLKGFGTGLDRRLQPLVRFRDHEYWYLPPERRTQRLLAAVRDAGPVLDTAQRGHVVLMLDLLFLLALSLLAACRYVSATSLADPKRALLTYLLGGSEQTRTREEGLNQLLELLRGLRDQGVDAPEEMLEGLTIEPAYFDSLAETVTRMLRRPRDAQRVLRYIEWWGQAQVALGAPPVAEVLGAPYGEFTRKLVGDIGRMCAGATGLGRPWQQLLGAAGNGATDEQVTDREAEASQLSIEA